MGMNPIEVRRRVAASMPHEVEKTGSVVSFVTDVASALKVVAPLAPVQDLHGQESPWHGGDGKNLISNDMFENGGIASAGGNTSSDTEIRQKTYFPVTPGTTFSVSCLNTGNTYFYVYFYNGTTMDSRTNETPFTVPENVDGIRIKFGFGENPRPAIADLVIQLEVGSSVTSWVPYENICPIAGWTGAKITRAGKNLYPVLVGEDGWKGNANGTFTNNHGVLEITTTTDSSSGVYCLNTSALKNFKVQSASDVEITYSFEAKSSVGGGFRFGYVNQGRRDLTLSTNWQRFSSKTTVNRLTAMNTFVLYSRGMAQTIYVRNLQIEIGSEPTAYAPFVADDVFNIEFPAGSGTVYGGTLTINKDGSGSLLIDRCAYAFGSADSFSLNGSVQTTKRFAWYKRSLPKPVVGTRYYINSHFINAVVTSSTTNFGLYCYASSGNNFPSVTIRTQELIDGLIDATGFNQWIADQETAGTPVQLVYTMETSVSYTLTPGQVKALMGINNLWADTGNVTVSKIWEH